MWIATAEAISARSLCSRSKVGAVIVNREHRIVATGYNGPPFGFKHGERPCVEWCTRAATDGGDDPTYATCPALHAEANALLAADRSTWQGGAMYTNSDLCWNCAKLVANSGLSTVIVYRPDKPADHRLPDATYEFLAECGLTVAVAVDTQSIDEAGLPADPPASS